MWEPALWAEKVLTVERRQLFHRDLAPMKRQSLVLDSIPSLAHWIIDRNASSSSSFGSSTSVVGRKNDE